MLFIIIEHFLLLVYFRPRVLIFFVLYTIIVIETYYSTIEIVITFDYHQGNGKE